VPPTIRVATLNLRNASDRWLERAPMLLDQFVALAPDVIGVQEIHVPTRQGEWIVRKVNERLPEAPRYALHQVNKTGFERLREGIGIISRLETVNAGSLDLRGGHRVAQRVRLRGAGGREFDVYNTHLHHRAESGALRLAQAKRIVAWMREHDDVPRVLVGDLNAIPDSPPVRALLESGLRCAYADVHGREPEGTVPAPLNSEWGTPPKTIDYILVSGDVRVHDARIVFDAVDPHDDRLSASDHYGIAAEISLA
jgi:endonuclease/exonuclease/phosphatase family metal-dependent hydrolase